MKRLWCCFAVILTVLVPVAPAMAQRTSSFTLHLPTECRQLSTLGVPKGINCRVSASHLLLLADVLGFGFEAKPDCWKPGFDWTIRIRTTEGLVFGTFKLKYLLPSQRSALFWIYPSGSNATTINIDISGKNPTLNCVQYIAGYAIYP